MRSIWIIKTGDTLPELRAQRGDFEDWIITGLGFPPEKIHVSDVVRGDPLPTPTLLAGVVVTGSPANVTERLPWGERTALWLRAAVAAGTPVLGICYGHQLLVHALDGEVGDNPRGFESGTVTADLTAAGQDDRLLGGLGGALRVHVNHKQTALCLPPRAVVLATTPRDAHAAVRFAPGAWGVQFHPEFDAQIMRAYVAAHRSPLLASGCDPEAVLAEVEETPLAAEILRRFAAEICCQPPDPEPRP